MDEESRSKKILHEINDEFQRDKQIIMGMTSEQRHVVAVVVMIVVVLALIAGLVWAGTARAGGFPITITCPKDQTNNTCTLSRDVADKVFMLIQHTKLVPEKWK